MVNANKHKAKKAKNQEETKEEFVERVMNGMQDGFKWSHDLWTIRQIVNAVDDGKLIDPDYQRGIVWKNPKNKALIETIFHHGGNKIPTITFRKLPNDEDEIVDGKQRLLSAIIPFVKDEFSLSGVYEENFTGKKFSDIKEEYPELATAFMGATIPVQTAKNMNDEEARIYFIQINSSNTPMNIGEQIHGMQGTPLIKTIEELIEHPVWDYVQNVKRYGEYAYISRMLLHVIDNEERGDNIIVYSNKQLINNCEKFYDVTVPKSAINTVKKVWDIIASIGVKYSLCLNVREFLPLFIYVHKHMSNLNLDKFSKFISGLYVNIHQNNGGVFTAFKNQPYQRGYDYNAKYYQCELFVY